MIPHAFKQYNQFINWREVQRADGKKPDKVPFDAMTGTAINPVDPANWKTADEVLQLAALGYGVAFVFSEYDPFFFLDIDNCTVGGQWSSTATTMCQAFSGCYVEVSHSGQGLHIFGTGVYPEHGCRHQPLGMEFYTRDRFVALTGTGAVGDAAMMPQASIDWLITNYFNPAAVGQDVSTVEWTTGPCAEWDGIKEDDKLIEKMLASKSVAAAFGGKATVSALWSGDTSAYGDDHSIADAALCQHLAFWTGKDCERIDRLFRESGLMRDKWDEQRGVYTYGKRTILGAVAKCTKVFGENKQTAPGALREGLQYMSVDKQIEHFKGCTYIADQHRILTPKAQRLKPDQFKAMYGGWCFALDNINGKSCDDAYKAFTQNQGYNFPKVDTSCFRPEEQELGIIEHNGLSMVNTYVRVNPTRQQGDVSPFLNHLTCMIPDEHDRAILLAWMAAVVQNPGKKIRWMPVIQGCQGNGKSMIMSVMQHAVGERYCHIVNAADLAKNALTFNAWLQGKLFVGFEEIYVPKRREVLEALKPYITEKRQEIQAKGADQFTGDNRANFIACTNYKDGVPKTRGDRRNCLFFTAQQSEDDLIRLGWKDANGDSTNYFPNLFNWLESEGYAIITDMLIEYQIPVALNPLTAAVTAPKTSSTNEAIELSLGGLEQDIKEAIDEGQPGFVAPWISSFALNQLIEKRGDGKKIPQNKRRDILFEMGYVYHPGLKGGRVTSTIPGEGGKPRLYVKANSVQSQITTSGLIVDSYLKAQKGMLSPFEQVAVS